MKHEFQGDEFDDEDFKFQMTVTNLHDAEDRVIDDNQALIAVSKSIDVGHEILLFSVFQSRQ